MIRRAQASGRVSGHCVPDRWRVRHRQLRRKAKCPQNSQRILGKSLERITDTADDAVCKVLLPAVEIDQAACAPRHRIDRKIAPEQILLK